MSAEYKIRRIANEAQELLNRLYEADAPAIGSGLDQAGLRNGIEIVDDYLTHGEAGLALEHLIYMISEPPLRMSASSLADIQRVAEELGMSDRTRRLSD